jgi:hypothetical protein
LQYPSSSAGGLRNVHFFLFVLIFSVCFLGDGFLGDGGGVGVGVLGSHKHVFGFNRRSFQSPEPGQTG